VGAPPPVAAVAASSPKSLPARPPFRCSLASKPAKVVDFGGS